MRVQVPCLPEQQSKAAPQPRAAWLVDCSSEGYRLVAVSTNGALWWCACECVCVCVRTRPSLTSTPCVCATGQEYEQTPFSARRVFRPPRVIQESGAGVLSLSLRVVAWSVQVVAAPRRRGDKSFARPRNLRRGSHDVTERSSPPYPDCTLRSFSERCVSGDVPFSQNVKPEERVALGNHNDISVCGRDWSCFLGSGIAFISHNQSHMEGDRLLPEATRFNCTLSQSFASANAISLFAC